MHYSNVTSFSATDSMLRSTLALVLVLMPLVAHADEGPSSAVSIRAENMEFLRQYAETYRFSLGRPKSAQVTPDGLAVLFLRSQSRSFVHDLFEFDCATGRERTLLTAEKILGGGDEQLSAEEKALRERLRLATRGIARYDLADDGTKILVPLSNRLFIIDRSTGQSKEVKSQSSAFPLDPRLSPISRQETNERLPAAQAPRSPMARPNSSLKKKWTAFTAIGGRPTAG
jgi:dipeptidyl-peptidase 4